MLKNGKNKKLLKPIENKLKIDMEKPCFIKVLPLESSPNKQIVRQVKFNLGRSKSRASFSTSKNRQNPLVFVRQGSRTKTLTESLKIKCEEKQNSDHQKINSKNSLLSSKKLKIVSKKNIIEQEEQGPAFYLNQNNFQESDSQVRSCVEQLFLKMVQLTKNCKDEKAFLKMKKENFTCFILLLLSSMSNFQQHKMTCCPEQILEIFKKMKVLLTNFNHSGKQLKLKHTNSTINQKIDPEDIKQSCKNEAIIISKLIDQKSYLLEQLQQIKQSLHNCSQQLRKSQQQLDNILVKHSQIKQKTDKLSQYHDQMSAKITGKEEYIAMLEEEVRKITYFSENQKDKPQLMEVSKQYKRIEEELFDYGYQLESRPELSSFIWEPKPFRLMEEYIVEDMEHINRDLLDSSIPQEQKFNNMKQFVLSSIRKFKRKDEQMMSVVKTKTEAIVQFISKLRMWLYNHEVKQTFLQRLKKQFAANSSKINLFIEQLLSQGSSFNKDELEKMKEMQKYWKYVEQNYKLGNSFY